ncbi:hypothetical protein Z517_01838 [Fonsecaea pedrosoi CBS 271.37]|uniref:Ketoreductase domain-containing protein n=1 Tax=Fonsecaea pedrosoi CBS 271.37 TaxID=1442368 RepID=A0A0D2E8H2_9EURO|nr:uncharacterized protein Z517_01838 [Fonsecaea pedrosoi CBS 271.37]KIW86441.1 hypothetical protein Z517_01838 [Fonsecaea pedrosoi CBS 271.37]
MITTEGQETGPDPKKETGNIQSLFSLDARSVIVTGATGGLGREVVKTLLQAGSDVIAVDYVQNEPIDASWENLRSISSDLGASLSYHSCDISDAGHTETVFEKASACSRFPLRGLVNCAGISILGDSITFPLDTARRIIDVNLVGSLIVAQAAARIVRKKNMSASFVFIASMSGYVVNKGVGTAAYSASKAGVHQLTRNLAAEWSHCDGWPEIRVNSISPGVIRTPMSSPVLSEGSLKATWTQETMLRRLSVPEDYRGPVVFLLSDASSYMTGADLLVDGGYTAW